MNGKFKLSKIAVILAGCSLVISCGGEESSNTKSDLYDYSKLSICVDADRNYACGAQEQKVSSLWSVAADNTAPFVIDNVAYLLTAPASANVVSPFTTLIQNEVLFNPQVSGSVAQAQAHLQQLFGDQYNLDFHKLNTEHGPKEATNLLLASFAHALSLEGDSKALKISAAVDKMVSSGNFDITGSLQQADLDNTYVNLNKRYLIPGSYPMRTLFSGRAITMNENTGMLLALTSGDKLLQVDTATGLSNTFTPATTTQTSPVISTYDDHDDDDDDDDDDHDGDDCDDDYGSLFGDDCNGGGTTQPASAILSAAQGDHNKNAYLIYQPTIYGDNTMSSTCNSAGNNGIFLTELGKNSQVSPLSSAPQISTYSSASGGTTPPVVVPVLPVSSAACKNNHINTLIVSQNHDTVTAVFSKGYYGQSAELKQLVSGTLKPTGNSYDLSSTQPVLILSKQQKSLFVLQNAGTPAVVINAQTLKLQSEIIKNDIDKAAFVNNDKQLIVSDQTNTLRWIDIAQGSSIATLALAENVLKLTSDPTGKYSAALTNKNLYLIDNETKSIIYSQAYTQRNVYGMSMLSNRIIISRAGAIDYIQFDNLTGTPIKVAKQMLSKDLLQNWSTKSGASLTDMTLAELLRDIGEEDVISQQFSDIDLQWRPTSATNIEGVKEVIITGDYRGQRISISKML
ncbi:hypothetical protein [Moritella dasanensis]|uniref:hypothetical protein n=1 Tax=Moritella dasanensis TaxID=428031 RepID=UPI000687D353|nr:hypothetical protein [Moritella dasanensis]